MAFHRVQLVSSSTITWSDGTPFNGYAILIMALPTQGGQQWTQVALRDCKPKRKCPQRVKVPIREGVYDPVTMLWSTDSLVPENVVYSAWYYDDTDQLIAIGSQLFSIVAGGGAGSSPIPYTLNPPTLPTPTAAISSPQPGSAPSTQVNTVVYGAPIRENVSGTKNGVNTAFTIGSAVYQVVMILWNQTVLTAGVQYTLSGANLTMIAPFIPGATDQLEDIRW
jgi:hypothetical protein